MTFSVMYLKHKKKISQQDDSCEFDIANLKLITG